MPLNGLASCKHTTRQRHGKPKPKGVFRLIFTLANTNMWEQVTRVRGMVSRSGGFGGIRGGECSALLDFGFLADILQALNLTWR